MEVIVIKNSNLSIDEYLHKTKPYLNDITINLQISDTWKAQLTIAINFISSGITEKGRAMYPTTDNIKFTPYNDANEMVNELFENSLKYLVY